MEKNNNKGNKANIRNSSATQLAISHHFLPCGISNVMLRLKGLVPYMVSSPCQVDTYWSVLLPPLGNYKLEPERIHTVRTDRTAHIHIVNDQHVFLNFHLNFVFYITLVLDPS